MTLDTRNCFKVCKIPHYFVSPALQAVQKLLIMRGGRDGEESDSEKKPFGFAKITLLC